MFWVRFRSSCIIAVLAVLSLVLGGKVLWGVLLAVSLIGMMELYRVLKVHRGAPGAVGYAAGILYFVLLLCGQQGWLTAFFIGFFLVLMLCYVLTFPKYRSEQITMVFFGFFYAAVMLSYVWQQRQADM